MNRWQKEELKWARRRFAVRYHFLNLSVGCIEDESAEVTPVTVTDTDGNVDLCLRHGIDPLKPAILVTCQPARMTVPPSARLTYPRTFEGFAVLYFEHEDP